MLNKWNKRKLCALIWSIPWLVFPNLASPTGRNTQGEQSIPGILVLCFRGHLAFSKPEVQDCWQKPKLWDSDFFFFFSWLQRLQQQLSSQSCECSGLTARAQGTALVKLREVCWSTSRLSVPSLSLQDYLFSPVLFPSFHLPYHLHSSTLHCNCDPREKTKDIYVTPMHPKL